MIDKCPVCKSPIEWRGVDLFCKNCANMNSKKIYHFLHTLGTKYITSDTISKIGVNSIEDVFTLKRSDLLKVPTIGNVKADIILREISNVSHNVRPEILIAALGIPGIGIVNAKKIVASIMKKPCNGEKILNIFNLKKGETGLGPKTEEVFLSEILKYKELVTTLLDKSLISISKEHNGKSLSGVSFSITGSLPITRDEVISIIEGNGGEFHKTVKKTTNYLIVGNVKGVTDKLKKAADQTKCISFDEFMKMI